MYFCVYIISNLSWNCYMFFACRLWNKNMCPSYIFISKISHWNLLHYGGMWVYKHFSGEFNFISGLFIVKSIQYETQTELYEMPDVIFIYLFLHCGLLVMVWTFSYFWWCMTFVLINRPWVILNVFIILHVLNFVISYKIIPS